MAERWRRADSSCDRGHRICVHLYLTLDHRVLALTAESATSPIAEDRHVANTGVRLDSYPVTEELACLATAAAKSIAPNTSIRGAGGAKDWTKTANSSRRRSPSGPYRRTPVRP